MSCEHKNFEADVVVHRTLNGDNSLLSFMADVKIRCRDCGMSFKFSGLERGLNLYGAMMSVDGLEARLAIVPSNHCFISGSSCVASPNCPCGPRLEYKDSITGNEVWVHNKPN